MHAPTMAVWSLYLLLWMEAARVIPLQEFVLFSNLILVYMHWWLNIRMPRAHSYKARLRFEDLTDYECKSYFRFEKEHIPVLIQALRIPAVIKTSNSNKFTATEALLILLWRISYPSTLNAGHRLFGRTEGALSEITNWMLRFITINYCQRQPLDTVYSY